MKGKATATDILSQVNEDRQEVKVSKSRNGQVTITIINKFGTCKGCSKMYKRELLKVRQDRRVAQLQVSQQFCPKCIKSVDYIIKHWKGREPRVGEIMTCK